MRLSVKLTAGGPAEYGALPRICCDQRSSCSRVGAWACSVGIWPRRPVKWVRTGDAVGWSRAYWNGTNAPCHVPTAGVRPVGLQVSKNVSACLRILASFLEMGLWLAYPISEAISVSLVWPLLSRMTTSRSSCPTGP